MTRTEIAKRLRDLRARAEAMQKEATEIEILVSLHWTEPEVPSGRFGLTTGVMQLLKDGPRSRKEIVEVLLDDERIESTAFDRRRALWATLDSLIRRAVIRREGDMVAVA